MAKLINVTKTGDGLSIGPDISAESGIVSTSLPLSLLCGNDTNYGWIFNYNKNSKKFILSDKNNGTITEKISLNHDGSIDLLNSNRIYWKENGYGDQFAIQPNFYGTNDKNVLRFRAAVGAAETSPDLYDIMTLSGASGNMVLKGKATIGSEINILSSSGGSSTLILDRGNTYSSWKLTNASGDLYLQNNYVNEAQVDYYFTVLKLNYSSGDVHVGKGKLVFLANNATTIENNHTGGTDGSAGYVNVLRMTCKASYGNAPIKFTVTQRRIVPYDVTFRPNAGSDVSSGATLGEFEVSSQGRGRVFAHLSGTIINFYVAKVEAYDNISISNLVYPDYTRYRWDVSFPNTHVTSLPSGYISPNDDKIKFGTSSTPSGNNGQVYIQY